MAVDYDAILGAVGGTPPAKPTYDKSKYADMQSGQDAAGANTGDALAILTKERNKPGNTQQDIAEIDRLIASAKQRAGTPAPAAPQSSGSVDYDAVSSMFAPATQEQFPNTAGGGRGGQGGPTAAQVAQRTNTAPAPSTLGTAMTGSSMPLVRMAGYLLQGNAPSVANRPATVPSLSDFGTSAVALGDTLGNSLSGLVKPVEYAVRRDAGQSPKDATQGSEHGVGAFFENPVSKFVNGATQLVTGNNPHLEQSAAYKAEASQKALQFVGQNMDKGADWISQHSGIPKADVANMLNTLATAAIPKATKVVGNAVGKIASTVKDWNTELKGAAPGETAATPEPVSPAAASGWGSASPQKSVGAAGTNLDTAFSQATPELQAAYQEAKRSGIPIDAETAERHLEADSLPVPIRLMPGQATGHPVLISQERNTRSVIPGVPERLAQQNEQLKANLDAIKDEAAPDVFATGPTENGEALINAYKTKDAGLKEEIGANYQALKDANGGDFPIDAQAFVANADQLLKKDMSSEFVPPAIASQLEKFRNGEPMTFEQFEAMRTNLAKEMRRADRAGDGNAEHASSLVRQALEDVPLSPEAANLKPLADKARASAKARFDLLDADPAYKAAVHGTVAPDDFVRKYVVNGKRDDIRTMRANLAEDPTASQHMAAGTIDWLKRQSGIVNGEGTFSQANYNKALASVQEKLGDQVGPKAAITAGTLGKVAGYVQRQGPGTFVNNSNTFVAGLKATAAGGVEKAANMAVPFANLGTAARNALDRRANAKIAKETLKTGAGLTSLSTLSK